jgi:uncharacterized protein
MASDLIRYDLLVQEALRSVLRKVLADTARDGLPGNHHFVIVFRTDAAGVRIPAKLREKYPQEMTVVLQHEFWDLAVTDQHFEVRLHFDRKPELLVIPFTAVTGFFDPSVEFGLKFEMANEAPAAASPAAIAPQATALRPVPPEKTKPRGSGSEPVEINPKLADQADVAKQALGKGLGKSEFGKSETLKSTKPELAKTDDAPPESPTKVVSIDAFRKK